MNFIEALSRRRSVYALNKQLPGGSAAVHTLLENIIHEVPSAFNSRSSRLLVLEGTAHDAFWDATLDFLRPLSTDNPEATATRIAGFKAAAGTILFFEDQAVVGKLEQDFPIYRDNFGPWSLQSSGMAQYAVWTALAQEGIGASLQHYNPLVDQWVHERFKTPPSWKLLAQMPFGGIASPGVAKDRSPTSERIFYQS